MTDVDKLRASALVDQALTQGSPSQDDALIARRPPQNALSTAAVEKWIDEAADRIEALTRERDEARHALALCCDRNATLCDARDEARANTWVQLGETGAMLVRATNAEAERDALRAAAETMATAIRMYAPGDDWCPSLRDALAVYDAALMEKP